MCFRVEGNFNSPAFLIEGGYGGGRRTRRDAAKER